MGPDALHSPVGISSDTGPVRAVRVRFRPGRRRRWPRRILVGVNVVVAAAIIGVASAYAYINVQFNRINREGVSGLSKAAAGRPFTLLIVGSDTRKLSGGSEKQFGTVQDAGGQRSDTIMLARVVPKQHQITLMSVPRDLYVPIQGFGNNRINVAFNSGASLLVQTIQSDLGIPINHYAEVNFDTFRDISDAVGGVRMWFPTPARDFYSLLSVPGSGCVNLVGDQALAFVRSRHYQYYAGGEWHDEAASDLARIQRQQAFVKRMVDKAKGEFTNPLTLNSIVSGITGNLTVDSGFSKGLLLSLAKTFRGTGAASIPTETLPTVPVTVGGADYLRLSQPEAQSGISAFNQLGTSDSSSTSSSTTGTTTPRAPAHAPAPSSVSVEVVNGSGVNGQAARATTDLTQLGYQASTNSSTRAYGATSNQIHYAPDALPSAQLLASKLTGGATLTMDSSLTSTSYNLELVTGTSYAGVGGASAPAPPPTTAPPSPAAPAGGATTTNYALPGTPPGEVPPASCTP